jgi:hypothetical protein
LAAIVEEGDFGYGFHGNPRDPYHVGAIRHQLTQCIGSRMPEMVEEINAALADDFDSIVTDGPQPFQILFPDYRLHSNSFV